jgi:hypothetical protein
LWEQSTDAWNKALSTLPSPDLLTETDKLLKSQFEVGLKNAEKGAKEPSFEPQIISKENTPWAKAMALEYQYISEQKMSSVSAFIAFVNFNLPVFQRLSSS